MSELEFGPTRVVSLVTPASGWEMGACTKSSRSVRVSMSERWTPQTVLETSETRHLGSTPVCDGADGPAHREYSRKTAANRFQLSQLLTKHFVHLTLAKPPIYHFAVFALGHWKKRAIQATYMNVVGHVCSWAREQWV